MAVPYTFGSATASIPLSQLDSNFATAITLGNTAVQLGNTITTLTGVSNVASAGALTLGSNGNTTAIYVDTSQNVGIGTTSPAFKFDISAAASVTARVINTSGAGYAQFKASGPVTVANIGSDTVGGFFETVGAYPSLFYTNSAERMRIDSSGNLLVGTTSGSGNKLDVVGGGIQVTASGTLFNLLNIKDSVNQSGATYVQFYNSTGGNIGNINRVTTTNAVVYNTTSDYRLKTVTGDVTGQGSRIDALKPIDYQWKEGNEQARGFLAHEFQTVYPNSVSGEKDAIDKDGNPKYQSMQASSSEVMADLIAEIQSLRKRLATIETKTDTQAETLTQQTEAINALTARVVALESK